MTTTIELYKTHTGQRLHILECPYVLGAITFEATGADLEICNWCAAELAEVGRTIHDSVEAALRDMGAPEISVPTLAKHLREVDFDFSYVPYSRSYVAVTKDGRVVAWAGKTYVGFRGGDKVLLPDYVAGGGSGAERRDVWGDLCGACFTERSLNGACGC